MGFKILLLLMWFVLSFHPFGISVCLWHEKLPQWQDLLKKKTVISSVVWLVGAKRTTFLSPNGFEMIGQLRDGRPWRNPRPKWSWTNTTPGPHGWSHSEDEDDGVILWVTSCWWLVLFMVYKYCITPKVGVQNLSTQAPNPTSRFGPGSSKARCRSTGVLFGSICLTSFDKQNQPTLPRMNSQELITQVWACHLPSLEKGALFQVLQQGWSSREERGQESCVNPCSKHHSFFEQRHFNETLYGLIFSQFEVETRMMTPLRQIAALAKKEPNVEPVLGLRRQEMTGFLKQMMCWIHGFVASLARLTSPNWAMTTPAKEENSKEEWPPCWWAPVLFLIALLGMFGVAHNGFATGIWLLDAPVVLLCTLVVMCVGVGLFFWALAPSPPAQRRMLSCFVLVILGILIAGVCVKSQKEQEAYDRAGAEYDSKAASGEYVGAPPENQATATAAGAVAGVLLMIPHAIQLVTGQSAIWVLQYLPEVEGGEEWRVCNSARGAACCSYLARVAGGCKLWLTKRLQRNWANVNSQVSRCEFVC